MNGIATIGLFVGLVITMFGGIDMLIVSTLPAVQRPNDRHGLMMFAVGMALVSVCALWLRA